MNVKGIKKIGLAAAILILAAVVIILFLENKIEKEGRIYLGNERVRDFKYDAENEVFFIIDEITPSIGILKFKD